MNKHSTNSSAPQESIRCGRQPTERTNGHSPWGRTSCRRTAGGWKCCASLSCRSHLHPPWDGTCQGTGEAMCCHGTPQWTATRTPKASIKVRNPQSPTNPTSLSWLPPYLVILLQNVVHFGDVLAGDDLDDVPLVIRGMEPRPAASLCVTRNGGAPSERVLLGEARVK